MMELRRLSLCLVLLAVYTQCSEAHSMHRRGINDSDYDDIFMKDEAGESEAQNDADGGFDTEDEGSIQAEIQTLPTIYDVTVGRTIRLECKVEPAEGAVIQWFRNGQPFFMGKIALTQFGKGRFSIADGSNDLLISDVKASDSGKFKCEVEQVQPAAIEHTLSVHEAPRVVKFSASDNGTVVEGSDLLLTCEVAGSPPPQIMWSKSSESGNVRLQERDGNFTLNSVLIENVKREHAGHYYCYAINSVGNAQAELTVKVLHKPRVHVPTTVINSAIDVEALLQCSAHGEPVPTITWFKDGNSIDSSSQYIISTEGSHSNLTVVPKSDDDFGTFTCEARNSHGHHRKSIEVVQRPVVEARGAAGRKLAWALHSHLPLQALELQLTNIEEAKLTAIDIPVPTPTNNQYEVIYVLEDLQPGKYEAVLKAKNTKEWSSSDEPIIVDYEAQPMYIQHASVYRGTDDSHSIRPTTSLLLSTVFMYLLVRMF